MNRDPDTPRWLLCSRDMGALCANIERISVVSLVVLLAATVFMGMIFRYLPVGTGLLTLGAEELGNLFLVWLWLWAGAAIHRLDSHFKLTVITDRVGVRTLSIITFINNIILVIFIVVLVKHNIQHFIGSLGVSTMGMEWPTALFVFPLLLGCPLIGIYTLIRLVLQIKRIMSR